MDEAEELPLVVSPHPCVYRKRALRALDDAGRRWRVACTSTSLAGAQAAVHAGLAVTVLPAAMVSSGFIVLGPAAKLPKLPATEIALLDAAAIPPSAILLRDHIVRSLERSANK